MNQLFSPSDIVRSKLCIGCGSCVGMHGGTNTEMLFTKFGELHPEGDPEWYQKPTQIFTQTCPFSPSAKKEDELAANLFPGTTKKDNSIGLFEAAYAGYVVENDFRSQGSSGGMVSWVATTLLRQGLVDGVAHVVSTTDPQTEGRFFKYQLSYSEAAVKQGAKSRYYPVEMSEIISHIREVPGRYAIIGIPCFIKAIQLLREQDPVLKERICFTLGLFCGHMKSARFVESFAWQMKVPFEKIRAVDFRYKDPDRPANWYNAMLTLQDGKTIKKDWWHLADGDWGAGFFMNNACNFCDDVMAETADISFGDAWIEPYASDGKGTNVIVVRSPELHTILQDAAISGKLHLDCITAASLVQTQAAGLRQRREGLAYRLEWATSGIRPIKRVAPGYIIKKERKIIYRLRYYISKWSHRVFWFAKRLRQPKIYLGWASMAAAIYHGLAYHKGKTGEIVKRFSQLLSSSK
ncbi:MAG: Coenzyme F420 hydrogenase/dehydrogenase, beta subunit C-terminal domain [Bacteroidota bacterium]